MKKRLNKLLCFVLVLILILLPSCVQKPQEEVVTEWEGKEEIEASNGEPDEATAVLSARYEKYKKLAPLAFSQSSVSPEMDFKFEINGNGATIIEYIGTPDIVVVPEMIGGELVVSVAQNAFTDKNVSALYIPDSVINIEKGALEGIKNLETLRLPFVGDGQENTHLGYIFGAQDYDRNATKVPPSLDMLIIGEGVEEIAENSFAGCKTLSCVVLPESVKKIGRFAFYECQDLVYVDLKAAAEIGNYAFGYCNALFSVSFAKASSIGLGALYECNSLRSLTLSFIGNTPDENRYIGYIFGAESADYNDELIPPSLYSVELINCKNIPDRAFASCGNIGEIYICDGVEKIGARAFYSCRSLKNIVIPDSVSIIGDDAFFGCDNLESVDIGAGVESMGMQTFYGCRSLKSIEIPEKITEIKPSTFALCEALENVVLNNVKKIGKDAFRGCSSVKPVDCSGIEVEAGNSILSQSVTGE